MNYLGWRRSCAPNLRFISSEGHAVVRHNSELLEEPRYNQQTFQCLCGCWLGATSLSKSKSHSEVVLVLEVDTESSSTSL